MELWVLRKDYVTSGCDPLNWAFIGSREGDLSLYIKQENWRGTICRMSASGALQTLEGNLDLGSMLTKCGKFRGKACFDKVSRDLLQAIGIGL